MRGKKIDFFMSFGLAAALVFALFIPGCKKGNDIPRESSGSMLKMREEIFEFRIHDKLEENKSYKDPATMTPQQKERWRKSFSAVLEKQIRENLIKNGMDPGTYIKCKPEIRIKILNGSPTIHAHRLISKKDFAADAPFFDYYITILSGPDEEFSFFFAGEPGSTVDSWIKIKLYCDPPEPQHTHGIDLDVKDHVFSLPLLKINEVKTALEELKKERLKEIFENSCFEIKEEPRGYKRVANCGPISISVLLSFIGVDYQRDQVIKNIPWLEMARPFAGGSHTKPLLPVFIACGYGHFLNAVYIGADWSVPARMNISNYLFFDFYYLPDQLLDLVKDPLIIYYKTSGTSNDDELHKKYQEIEVYIPTKLNNTFVPEPDFDFLKQSWSYNTELETWVVD